MVREMMFEEQAANAERHPQNGPPSLPLCRDSERGGTGDEGRSRVSTVRGFGVKKSLKLLEAEEMRIRCNLRKSRSTLSWSQVSGAAHLVCRCGTRGWILRDAMQIASARELEVLFISMLRMNKRGLFRNTTREQVIRTFSPSLRGNDQCDCNFAFLITVRLRSA